MKIKSDIKPESKIWKCIKGVVSDIVDSMQTMTFKIIISIILFFSAYVIWEYSGLLSLLLIIFDIIILFGGENQTPTIGEKSLIGGKSLFAIFAIIIVAILGTNNVYKKEIRVIPVKFSKIVYTDSTEKTVIFMTEPIKKAVVVNFDASEYYMMKELDQNLTIKIIETGEFAHWDKLEGEGVIDEYKYDLVLISPDQNFTMRNWSKKKDGERQFVKADSQIK